MASACCLHQISGPPVGSNGLKQQETDRRGATPSSLLGLRSPWLCSHGRRRLLQSATSGLSNSRNHRVVAATSAATALVRTIATTPDSEVGASDAEGNSVTDGKAAEVLDDAEKTEEEKLEDTEKTEQEPKKPRYKRPKSLIHILETLHKQAIEAATKDRQIPDIRPGYVVQIKLEVPETKRRVSMLRGIVICRRNSGVNTTFTIRRIIAGVGVEMVFPLYSPNIKEITVLAKKKVRRAKLYYLRNKLAKFSSF